MRTNERMTQRVPAPAPQEARRPADTERASPRQGPGNEAQRRFQQAMRRAEQGATDEPRDEANAEADVASPPTGAHPPRATLAVERRAATDPVPPQDPTAAVAQPLAHAVAAGRAAQLQEAAPPAVMPAEALGTPSLPPPALAGLTRPPAADLPPPAPLAPPSATWLALQRSALATEGPSPQWRLLLPDVAGPAHAVALQRTAGGRLAVQVQLNASASTEALARHAAHLDDTSQEEAQP
ncbi:MAG: hypothetical protein IIZ92_14215 [Aquincola sp.]|nr:hypothetical protein [Aquincola sp.]